MTVGGPIEIISIYREQLERERQKLYNYAFAVGAIKTVLAADCQPPEQQLERIRDIVAEIGVAKE